MMLSRLTEAAQAFQQAVSSPQAKDSETQAMADWMIAETLIKQEQYDKARLHCLEVERKYPQFPLWQAHALFDAGVACEKLGRTQDAGAYYQRVVTDFGQISNVLTAKAEDRLRAISGARSANRQDINRNNVRQ